VTVRHKKTPNQRRLVDLGLVPDQPRPDGGEARERKVFKFAAWASEDKDCEIVQVEERLVSTGRLVEFAIMLQLRGRGADEWQCVERIDCAHGSPTHLHVFAPDGSETRPQGAVPSSCLDDLDKALKWAVTYMWDTERRLEPWL
jgi:hypothetical protein